MILGNDNKYIIKTYFSADNVDDPLQMLQELITDGSLIKEAVKRLQEGLFRSSSAKTFYESEDDEGDCTPPNDLEDLWSSKSTNSSAL